MFNVSKNMEYKQVLEERLRKASCIGDTDAVQELVNLGVDVNTRHNVNGWTPLHWACKRGFLEVAALLLKHGADKNIMSESGETAVSLCTNQQILQLLNSDIQPNTNGPMIHQFMPKCIKNELLTTNIDSVQHLGANHNRCELKNNNHLQDELVVKLRIANAPDPDFVEVELPMNDLTYQTLIQTCCEEFGLCPYQILKLRKLPNTKLRKDKDVKRLQHFQEIEIITDPANVYKHMQYSNSVPNNVLPSPANGYQSISNKDQTILY
ncbi:PREDICTED: ankyrin repeat domain-containing protein 40-like isoform X2 [Polistes dominula]|uniref:Ankyrin repeat domain-containing protein 40-like isoform X2 n=1 Tax=Polistes dominula TaxID=743375 RepID=A0ABM1IGR7_POLDO|nr:PREDICTED: ankyrin repeat domain-containing protein 40-like isoform X2 [Polistes dominula]